MTDSEPEDLFSDDTYDKISFKMRYLFFISCVWTMFTSCLTFAESPDLFSLGADEDIETDEALTMNDNANNDILSSLANSDGLSIFDDNSDLFNPDPSISSTSNVILADESEPSDFLHQPFADLDANKDPPSLFLADTFSSIDTCLPSASKFRKVRMRSESCSDPGEQQQPIIQPSEADEATQRKIRKKWCSFQDQVPVGKYPVCKNGDRYSRDLVPLTPSPAALLLPIDRASPYQGLVYGTLSRFFLFSFFYIFGGGGGDKIYPFFLNFERTFIYRNKKKNIFPCHNLSIQEKSFHTNRSSKSKQ